MLDWQAVRSYRENRTVLKSNRSPVNHRVLYAHVMYFSYVRETSTNIRCSFSIDVSQFRDRILSVETKYVTTGSTVSSLIFNQIWRAFSQDVTPSGSYHTRAHSLTQNIQKIKRYQVRGGGFVIRSSSFTGKNNQWEATKAETVCSIDDNPHPPSLWDVWGKPAGLQRSPGCTMTFCLWGSTSHRPYNTSCSGSKALNLLISITLMHGTKAQLTYLANIQWC